MKTLQATDLQITNRQFKIDAVIRQIETIFQAMQFPDVEGIQIYQLLSDNLHYEGDGVYAVQVNQLQDEVEFVGSPHSVWLRNHNGVLQYSNDHSVWADVGSGGSGGSGDMTKAVYDPQDTGRVLSAEKIADATHETTAANLAGHLADSTIHFVQTDIDHGNLQNSGVNTHAQIDDFIAAGVAMPEVINLPSQMSDPAPPTEPILVLYAKDYQEGMLHSMKPTIIDNAGHLQNIVLTGATTGTIDDDLLSENVMLTGTYVDGDGLLVEAKGVKMPVGNSVTAQQIINHLLGYTSTLGDGSDLIGIAFQKLTAEPSWTSDQVALVYCFGVGDPLVYELRVLFPDGTRRKITTEMIV